VVVVIVVGVVVVVLPPPVDVVPRSPPPWSPKAVIGTSSPAKGSSVSASPLPTEDRRLRPPPPLSAPPLRRNMASSFKGF